MLTNILDEPAVSVITVETLVPFYQNIWYHILQDDLYHCF